MRQVLLRFTVPGEMTDHDVKQMVELALGEVLDNIDETLSNPGERMHYDDEDVEAMLTHKYQLTNTIVELLK